MMKKLRAFRSQERDERADEERYVRLLGEMQSTLEDLQNEQSGLHRRIRLVSTQLSERSLWGRTKAHESDGTSELPLVDRDPELKKAVERLKRVMAQIEWLTGMVEEVKSARQKGMI